jgi:hypothetical protein
MECQQTTASRIFISVVDAVVLFTALHLANGLVARPF